MSNTHKIVRTIRKMQNNNKILIYRNKNGSKFTSNWMSHLQSSGLCTNDCQADGHEIQIKIIVKQHSIVTTFWNIHLDVYYFKFYDYLLFFFSRIKKSFNIENFYCYLEIERQQLIEQTVKQFEWRLIQMEWNLTHRRWFVSMKNCLLPMNTSLVFPYDEKRLNCN